MNILTRKQFFIVYIILWTLCIISVRFFWKSELYGFAVDSNENIYLGYNSVIEVYHNNQLVRELSTITDRGYDFTIMNDKLLLDVGFNTYRLDLYGNIIEEDIDKSEYRTDYEWSKQCDCINGRTYYRQLPFGRIIIKNDEGETIFREPIASFTFKIAKIILWILWVVFHLELLFNKKYKLQFQK